MLSLFSQNFKPRLVMPKFQASISVYCAAKLPPIQPAPCYPKITTRAKTPTSCEIPAREIPVIPLNRKNRLAQIGGGTFVTYPTFWTSVTLSHGSPLPSHPPTHSYIEAAKTREAPHPPSSATQPEPLPRHHH